MSTRLGQLLDSIDPAMTFDVTSNRADEALNSFDFDAGQITDWNDFKACIADFFTQVEAKMLQLHPCPLDMDYHWGRCVRVLFDVYGGSGEKVAFEMARTGKEGGLYTVLKAIALRMAEHYAENEISARIGQYWEQLTVDEQLSATTEYLEKYGHLLPSEMTEGGAARIRANFLKVLQKHPRLLQKTRRVGR